MIETKRRKGGKRKKAKSSNYPVAGRVAISVDPLASTRTKNEESPIQTLARAWATERLFWFLLGRAKALPRAEKWHGPVSVSRVRSGNLVFHLPSTKTKADNLFHRMARGRKNRRLPLVMADCRTPKGWWRWRSGRDDAVLPVFHPCENATSENWIFHHSGRYDAVSDKSRKVEISLERQKRIFMRYY